MRAKAVFRVFTIALLLLMALLAACAGEMSRTDEISSAAEAAWAAEYTLAIDQAIFRAEEMALLPPEQLNALYDAILAAISMPGADIFDDTRQNDGIAMLMLKAEQGRAVSFYGEGLLEVAAADARYQLKISESAAAGLAAQIAEIGGRLREIRKEQNLAAPPST